MIKRKTGVEYTPEQYRKLNRCLTCGKACDIKKESLCKNCLAKNFKRCEICEIILKEGWHKYYKYDTKENLRDVDLHFKVSKNIVKEFLIKDKHDKLKCENICNSCIGWEQRIKNICYWCDKEFINNKENYKLYGNACIECVKRFEKINE